MAGRGGWPRSRRGWRHDATRHDRTRQDTIGHDPRPQPPPSIGHRSSEVLRARVGFVCLSVCVCGFPFVYLFIYLSIFLFVCPLVARFPHRVVGCVRETVGWGAQGTKGQPCVWPASGVGQENCSAEVWKCPEHRKGEILVGCAKIKCLLEA